MRKTRWWLAACIALLGTMPVHPGGTEIDVATAKKFAVGLTNNGQPKAALAILTELAQHRSDDPEIFIALSRTHRTLGDTKQAIQDARQGFALSQTKTHKHLSARTMAEALASDGQRTRAQFWLRRAGQTAPNEAAEAAVRRDYAYVRSRNPWSFRFSGSVTPSNNLNDAPKTDEILIGGLVFTDPTARPIRGLKFSFSAKATYRLPASEFSQNEVSLGYDLVRVRLGSSADDINPDLENSDFSADRLTLGWAGKFRFPNVDGVYDASARVFADLNGGSHTQNGIAVAGGYSFKVAERNFVRLGGEIEYLDRLDRPVRSSTTYRLSGRWTRPLNNKDVVGMELTLSDSDSDSFAVAHRSARLRATYFLSKPVMTADLGFVADLRTTLFDDALFGPDRRADNGVTLSAHATFSDWGIYGFAPVLELQHKRVFSNVSRFDTETTQLSISFRSTY